MTGYEASLSSRLIFTYFPLHILLRFMSKHQRKSLFSEISLKSLLKIIIKKKHLPAGVVWDEVATVLDTGLTRENKILFHTSLIDMKF